MKAIMSIFLFSIITILQAQDAGMEIIVDQAIISGGQGALNLQSPSGKSSALRSLLIDGSDIQSYNQDSSWYCGSLYIQDQGGSIYFLDGNRGKATFQGNVVLQDSIMIGGSIQTTASSEIAFGSISKAGFIYSGSGNYTVTWTGSRYEIEIEHEEYHYQNYSSIITPNSSLVYSVYSTSDDDKLIVVLRDNDGDNISAPFHFVTHKHISSEDGFFTSCGEDEPDIIQVIKNKLEAQRD